MPSPSPPSASTMITTVGVRSKLPPAAVATTTTAAAATPTSTPPPPLPAGGRNTQGSEGRRCGRAC